MVLKNLNYPLDFKFKITTLSSDFTITDNDGDDVAYVRQKMFRMKEDVIVFDNQQKTEELFQIKADRWLDFNASYRLNDLVNQKLYGRMARKGMRSIWKSTYEVFDDSDQLKFIIKEDNAWVKIWDSLFGEIPIIGMFAGYVFHPSYSLRDLEGNLIFQLRKMPSLIGRRFKLDRFVDMDDEDETRCVLSFLMMVLLERRKG